MDKVVEKGSIEHAEKVFHIIAVQYDTFDEMVDALDNRLDEDVITQEEYDYIWKYWGSLLYKFGL